MTTNRKHRFLALFFLPVFVFAFSFFFDPVISKAASASTDGTFYAALADISGSMPEDAFVSGRSGIRELSHRLGASDSMSVITFGDAVTEIASFNGGDQANADNALQVLDTILPHDQTTKFYEALGFLQQRAAAAPQPIKRAVIMTDGVDVSDMTPETATSLMNGFYDNNIRIYGVLVESRQSTPETTAQFTNFCEKTGGAVEVVSGADANAAYQNVISKMTSVNVIKEEQERFEDAYEETGETVPIEHWTAGIPETPDTSDTSEKVSDTSSSEDTPVIVTGIEGDKDGNGILDEYENGGAEKTRPNALELIKPYLPVIIGVAAAVAAVIVLIILLSRRRSSGDGGFRTHGAGKGERIVKESANEEAPQDEPKKKEKEKREKNKDKVEFFFSEKKDDE